jgi:DUF4097 and DUF4098 domain-containing protein YvlB
MKRFALTALILALAAVPALANEATFERNLNVNGHVELTVITGSGHIHITHGSGDRVHIVGHVKSNWGSNENRVQEIANNPPVEQTGNIIRVGQRHENYHNISIDYDIEAPANSFLEATSGSGDINDDGVGQNAKLGTGSGGIHATGLQGGFNVNTGSGNIYAEQTGQGDVKAQTGSGNVELKNVSGSLHAGTGSGDIKVAGTPSSDWKLETGSGSVEFWAGNAGLTLDASTGSGSIRSDPEMTVQGSFDKHHIVGKIHGGGPTVRIETGSGDVRVH